MNLEEWRLFRPPRSAEGGLLLAKWSFATNKYDVKVTDLVHVWSESLDGAAIIARAHKMDCSIDPAEDASQIQVFLQKIEGAFLQRDGTKMDLSLNDTESCIEISTSSDLPKPLKPLHWNLYLHRLPAESMRAEVILPLMHGSFVRQRQIAQLQKSLQEKDNAIGKLADKVEGLGIDLSSLFPHATGSRGSKRHMSREQLFNQIRGLGSFDQKSWEAEWLSELQTTCSFQEVAKHSFVHSNSTAIGSLLDEIQHSTVQAGDHTAFLSGADTAQSSSTLQDLQSQEFQRKSTPPHAGERHSRRTSKDGDGMETKMKPLGVSEPQQADDDDTTEDEDDLEPKTSRVTIAPKAADRQSETSSESEITTTKDTDAATVKDQEVSREQSRPQSSRKLGLIGGKKRGIEQIAGNAEKISDNRKSRGDANKDTMTERLNTTQPARKIGMIGGRKNKTSEVDEAAVKNPDSSKDTAELPPAPKTTGPTRSTVGTEQSKSHVKGVSEDVTDKTGANMNSRSPEVGEEEEVEDPQEKADRKRQALKRDLEARNKPAPKKKRKF